MPEYHFRGTARMNGVDFYINADSLEEAKARAKKGESDLQELDCAEMYDWDIEVSSGRINE